MTRVLPPWAARSDCRIALRAEYSLPPARTKRQHILPMTEPKISSIGKYRIIELVGEGAMGVVYRAQDSVLERTVAIKVMNESIARQEDLRKRFLHEAQAAGSLQHPNVVTIYDLGEVDGHLFIAMEFVQGVDLEHLIELGEPLSLQARARHHHRRPHRARLRPQARHRASRHQAGQHSSRRRRARQDHGLRRRASRVVEHDQHRVYRWARRATWLPSRSQKARPRAATDIFAVGGVLYQFLAQMKPFDAPDSAKSVFQDHHRAPASRCRAHARASPALDRIVRKAMAKEPAQRYASALDMANDLTNVRSKLSGPSYPASVSLSASVASAIEQTRKTSEIRTRKYAYAGGGVLAAAAVIAIAWSQVSKPGSATLEAADKPAVVATPASAQPTAGATYSRRQHRNQLGRSRDRERR